MICLPYTKQDMELNLPYPLCLLTSSSFISATSRRHLTNQFLYDPFHKPAGDDQEINRVDGRVGHTEVLSFSGCTRGADVEGNKDQCTGLERGQTNEIPRLETRWNAFGAAFRTAGRTEYCLISDFIKRRYCPYIEVTRSTLLSFFVFEWKY